MTGQVHLLTAQHYVRGVRRLRGSSDPDTGFVVVAVPPDMRRRFELSWEVLQALGKLPEVGGSGRNDDLNWELVHTWLLAHDVRHLVFVDAQWLNPDLFADVCGLAPVCDVTVWLVAHEPVDDDWHANAEQWHITTAAPVQLAKLLPKLTTAPVLGASFPDVPADNWPTFRAACRDNLASNDFAVVDDLYRDAFTRFTTWFVDHPDADEKALHGALRDAAAARASVPEIVTVTRAMQAAAFRSGRHVQVDLDRLLATADDLVAAAAASPATWARLRAYREPYRGAAAALASAGCDVPSMLAVLVDNVATDGGSTVVGGRHLAAPSGAAVFLRAQRWHRTQVGATGRDPLFAAEDGPLRDRHIANALRAMATEVGVPLTPRATARSSAADNANWRARWGLCVQDLK